MSNRDYKEIAARWLDTAFNNYCELEKQSEVIAKDNPLSIGDILLSWKFLHTQFSNVKARIVDQIAEGNKVVTRLDVQGIENGVSKNWEAIYIHAFNENAQIVGPVCTSTLPMPNVTLNRGSQIDNLSVRI